MLSFKKVIIALAVLGLVTVWPRTLSDNDASRMGTIQSLVEARSLTIENTAFRDTGDKVFVDGHFYSDKAVMTAVFGALVYFPLHLLGLKLDLGWNLAYYLITLIVVKGLWLAGLIAFYHALGFTALAEKPRIWLTLALGVASLYFAWTSTYNNHAMAAALLMIGFYFILKARFRPPSYRASLALAGFFLSLAGTTDVPNGAFYAGFLIYIIADRRLRSGVVYYLLPLVATVLPALALNYSISGSLMPVQTVRAYFEYPGSKWVGAKGKELSGMGVNQLDLLIPYAFNSLIGSKGFILYNPLLFLAIPYLIRECGPKREFRKEALTIGLASAVIVSYYLLVTNNYGGWSYSIRWFVPLLPMLYFFIHPFLEELTVRRKSIFATLFAVSAVIAVIGLFNPWSVGYLSKYPLISNLKLMSQTFNAISHQ
jgi:hypothetical protein